MQPIHSTRLTTTAGLKLAVREEVEEPEAVPVLLVSELHQPKSCTVHNSFLPLGNDKTSSSHCFLSICSERQPPFVL